MIPKAATSLFHFSAARVAAAVQTSTTQTITPSLINALQFQPQQQLANAASNATSLGWSAGASGATSSASSNAASAKFNAGGRFYNAYQVRRLFLLCLDILEHVFAEHITFKNTSSSLLLIFSTLFLTC